MDIPALNDLKSKILIFLYLRDKALQEPYMSIFDIQGLDNSDNINIVIEDLKLEKLVESGFNNIRLTTAGIYEVEVRYFRNLHSGNVTIINISNMMNSAIQQGSPNGNISLTLGQVAEIQKFLATVDDNLDLNVISKAMMNNQSNTDNLVKKYFETLLIELKSFRIEGFDGILNKDEPWGTKIEHNLQRMFPLRNKLLDLFYTIIDYSFIHKNDLLHNLLNQLLQFNYVDFRYFSQKDILGYIRSENYRIVVYEIFLYVSAYLLKEEKFTEFTYILHHPYQIQCIDEWQRTNEYWSVDFVKFDFPVNAINDPYRRNSLSIIDDRVHLMVELLKERNKGDKKVSWNILRETDALLYFISIYNSMPRNEPLYWTPYLLPGLERIEVMQKSVSHNYFEKVISIFKLESFEEFMARTNEVINLKKVHDPNFRAYFLGKLGILLNLPHLNTQP